MTDDRIPAEAGAWELLRDRVEAGDVGGPNDDGVWHLHFSCICGESIMHPIISVFLDLLAAMWVLAWRHSQGFQCLHVWRNGMEADEAFAMLAVEVWRDTYGIDPDVLALT